MPAELDPGNGELTYLNAGNPPPVLLRDGRMAGLLDAPVRTPPRPTTCRAAPCTPPRARAPESARHPCPGPVVPTGVRTPTNEDGHVTLPYGPDDDQAADRYINNALRSRDAETWRLLASDAHVEQTDRVLRAMLDRIAATRTHRTADRATARVRALDGEISQAEYQRDAAEDATRATKTAHFETLVREHHRLIAPAARRLRGDDVRDELTDLVLALGSAIDAHRTAVLADGAEPTAADQALWARLTTLDVPGTADGEGRASVEELVKRHSTRQDDLGRVLAGIILDAAGEATSVPRATLLAAWKKAVAPVLALEEKAEFAAKGKGSLLTEKLRKTMGHLERKGLVKRSGPPDAQRLDVLDRPGLEELAGGPTP